MKERRRPPNAWINWKRIIPDIEEGFPPSICAARENHRLGQEGEKRRVSGRLIRNYAYLNGIESRWDSRAS